MDEARADLDAAHRLALLIHRGPVQVLSAAALRLELLALRLSDADATEVRRAADDVRSAVLEIQRHTNAEVDAPGNEPDIPPKSG